tara:strand:- start:116 stop:583 length:468 start_codon:yes stop_codon:yes gene_type:complete
MLDAKFWKETGIDIVACYRKHIFDPDGKGSNAKDIHGNDYKGYKNPQDPYSYGNRKRTGKLFRQASSFKDSNAPVLTSDLARDFKVFKSHSTGFGFGAIAQRGKVKQLAQMGRVITTKQKPIPEQCSELLMKELDKYTKKELKKNKGKKINIKVP